MNDDLKNRWAKCCEFIRDNIGKSRFDTWFSPSRPISFEDNVFLLEVPTHYYYKLYENTFFNVLSAAVKKAFGPDVLLKYHVRMIDSPQGEVTLPHAEKSKFVGSKLDIAANSPQNRPKEEQASVVDSQLNPNLTFESYCVGDSNRLASTIAQAIADKPKNSDFNPFFLYGDVGVGKTHLVQAIGIRVREKFPQSKVLYTTAREFQHLYARAVIDKAVPNFINWFMQLDVLILDDLQEIANKTKTSEALFPIFNHLHQNGRQLIFTCDRPPMELDGIADRLIDRFKWGLTERLPRPDEQLRKQILISKARRNGLDIPEEVIDYVAAHAVTSVREIEGVVMGILTRCIQLNAPISLKIAQEVMKNVVKIKPQKPLNFDMIVEATAEYYNLNPDVLFSKSRVRDIADARQVVMYLCHKLTKLSSTAIGQKLNRSHGTVLHGIAAVDDHRKIIPELSKALSAIEKELR